MAVVAVIVAPFIVAIAIATWQVVRVSSPGDVILMSLRLGWFACWLRRLASGSLGGLMWSGDLLRRRIDLELLQ